MLVLEWKSPDGGHATVTRLDVGKWQVEVWHDSKFYHARTEKSFELAEAYYWKLIKKELV